MKHNIQLKYLEVECIKMFPKENAFNNINTFSNNYFCTKESILIFVQTIRFLLW